VTRAGEEHRARTNQRATTYLVEVFEEEIKGRQQAAFGEFGAENECHFVQ